MGRKNLKQQEKSQFVISSPTITNSNQESSFLQFTEHYQGSFLLPKPYQGSFLLPKPYQGAVLLERSKFIYLDKPEMAFSTISKSAERLDAVDMSRVVALNERLGGSVKTIFLPVGRDIDSSQVTLESNSGDPELLIYIPFKTYVKLHSITIVGGTDGTAPKSLRLFVNHEVLDFNDVHGMIPTQEWDLSNVYTEDAFGMLSSACETRASCFSNVGSITLHFPQNLGSATTKIHSIGLKGEVTQFKKQTMPAGWSWTPGSCVSEHLKKRSGSKPG